MAQIHQAFWRNVRQIENLRHLNAFVTENIESASEMCSLSVERHENGEKRGPLDGTTFSVKDNICTEGIRTTCGSKFLKDYISPFTATAVERLLKSGSIMVGKTNLDEFGMGGASIHSHFGHVLNPHSDTTNEEWLISGGSSGGSAVSVAADMCTYSLGSDTGGSVRIPASFCGVVGIKPTYGRVSRFGLVPYASSMDTIGVLAKDASTCSQVLDVISGWDHRDATSSPESHVTCTDILSDFRPGIRIGVLKGFSQPLKCNEYGDVVEEAVQVFRHQGAVLREVELPDLYSCVASYYILCAAEASSNMAKYSGMIYGYRSSMPAESAGQMLQYTKMEALGEIVRRRINVGKYFLSQEGRDHYDQANKIRHNIIAQFHEAFKEVDLILTPSTIGPAPTIEEYKALDSVESDAYDTFVCPANLCGLPAVSVPFGRTTDTDLPLGIQLFGPHFHEHRLLQAAHFLQNAQ